jgi:hypothetical protein
MQLGSSSLAWKRCLSGSGRNLGSGIQLDFYDLRCFCCSTKEPWRYQMSTEVIVLSTLVWYPILSFSSLI